MRDGDRWTGQTDHLLYCTGRFGVICRGSRLVEGVEHRVRHIALFSSVLHGSVGVAFDI
jgi:hypothetical protein